MQQPITVDSPEVFSSEKETYYFDRKSARKDTAEIAKHISAFANAAGASLLSALRTMGRYLASRETVLARSRTSNERQ